MCVDSLHLLTREREILSARVKIVYNHYFGCKVGDHDKYWAPHTICGSCYSGQTMWLVGKRKRMPFGVLMVWRETKDHTSDCYFVSQRSKELTKRSIMIVNLL